MKSVKSTILSDVRVGRFDVRTLGCSCADNAFIVNVLKRLGLDYIAGMHARSKIEWTPKDWYLHAKQEDDHLFPMLLKIANEDKYLDEGESEKIIKEVKDLIDDHIKFVYPVVSKNELPDEQLMKVHGDRENALIKKYYRQLLHLPITTLINKKTSVGSNRCSICKNYAWDRSIHDPVLLNGKIHHPSCSEIKSNVSVGLSLKDSINEVESIEISPTVKIALGITVGGVALAFGAPLIVAAIPLFAAGASVALSPKSPDFSTTSITPIELAIWESNTNIPSDKLNNRGQKFIDPYAIDGACWPGVNQSGINSIMALPKDGRVRVEFMHKNALASKPRVMPAADLLISTADSFGAKALESVGKNLKDRQKLWANKISEYAKYTQNGYVIALAELYAAFLRWMPASWNSEYKRASSIAEDSADQLKTDLITTIGFSFPYPMHSLDDEISSLDDLKFRTSLFNSNLKKTLVLPNKAKELLRSFFALLASFAATDSDVQSAINYVDNSDWGRRNLASDEQVYLVGVVLAKSIGEDVIKFTSELWNRSQGWNRFKGLATNSHVSYLKTANGSIATNGDSSNGGFVYEQDGTKFRKWIDKIGPDEETGFEYAANCITNARQLNYLDIILTGFQMISEKTGTKNPVSNNMIKINKI